MCVCVCVCVGLGFEILMGETAHAISNFHIYFDINHVPYVQCSIYSCVNFTKIVSNIIIYYSVSIHSDIFYYLL